MQPSVEGVLTIYLIGSTPLNKMVSMPIDEKQKKKQQTNKQTTLRTKKAFRLNLGILVYSIEDSRCTKFVHMMILG